MRVLLVLVLVCVFGGARTGVINEKELKRYKSLVEGQGLYYAADDVDVLTVHNFDAKLYGSAHPWFVEFYNTWCGHCQRFAPTWKGLATDVFAWKDSMPIGAIDCSDEDNSQICRDFEVMAYPTLRYFHEDYPKGQIGVDVTQGKDVDDQRDELLKRMIEEQKTGRGNVFPNLLPYVASTTETLFEYVSDDVDLVFLVFENNSLYGAAAAMDFHNVPKVAVKYALKNNSLLARSVNVTQRPAILIMERDGSTKVLTSDLNSRKKIRDAIRDFLKTKGIATPNEKRSTFPGNRKWTDSNATDVATLLRDRQLDTLRGRVKQLGDVVLQMDLETALRYSLKKEIARTKNLTDEKFAAAKAYVNVLTKYFPFGDNGKAFLAELSENLNSRSSISGAEIAAEVAKVEGEESRVFSSPPGWLGCRGSTGYYRGFPCGVWMMFHFLTVNAAEQNAGRPDVDPKEVLMAMLGYVKNFFGCAECSQHFQDMAREKDMTGVNSLEMQVLWLWMAHNTVNKRLAGDPTEDPEYPKYQFPSVNRCASCWTTGGSWNYTEVLAYLKLMYSSKNVRYIGSDWGVVHGGSNTTEEDDSLLRSLDGSMCFAIYVFSFLLIAVLMRLFLRRGYRKKMYAHDILGKV